MKKEKQKDPTEKLKEGIEMVSKMSKKTIKEIIDSSSKQFDSALDANKEFIDTIEKQVFGMEFMDGSIISEVKKNFAYSVELSEDAIDSIIEIQSGQLLSAIEFNTKLMEVIKNFNASDKDGVVELVEIIKKNFEESSNRSIENTKKMTEMYNKHVNLATNFNEKFSKNISSQMKDLNIFQNKNMHMFNGWANQWWKDTSKEDIMA